ncbi:DUF4124 domain-containing protein [Simiduia curdlanivorans]|uniref:DUF4124 domain-containing protein n=1 Tax=Simiduia curdlanivorans TaxID=1492769 RepID=A0ABV8V1C4_9GAMM|nr:DUF4124 domain-containing protein [Simiduia curdlanivorans]MDN3637467.1 DUF4124 domain-containing protein [Simiduia curdlanivorans]
MNTCLPRFIFSVLAVFGLHHSDASAAIYTWVDANGKTHYSDQPLDKKAAREVDVAPINIMEGGKVMTENAARAKAQAADEAESKSQAAGKKYDPCKNDLAKYQAFTEQQFYSNGRPRRYYLNNPDGSSMTEKQQTEFILQLGEDLRDRGCI